MYVIEFVRNLVFDRKLDLWHTVLALNGYSIVRSVDSSIGMLWLSWTGSLYNAMLRKASFIGVILLAHKKRESSV